MKNYYYAGNTFNTTATSHCIQTTPETMTATANATIGAPNPGVLSRLQRRLWRTRAWWFGNRISDVRYVLWRLIR